MYQRAFLIRTSAHLKLAYSKNGQDTTKSDLYHVILFGLNLNKVYFLAKILMI